MAASIVAVACLVHCASKDTGREYDSHFAKSLREADPTRKEKEAAKPRDPKEPAASEFALPGRSVRFEYHDAKLKQPMVLVNRSAPELKSEEGDRTRSDEAAVKVASDDLMADLFEAMRRLEFVKYAKLTEPHGETVQWTLSSIVDGVKTTVSYVRGRPLETQTRCRQLQDTFLYAYNRVFGLRQPDTSGQGKALFEEEQRRLREVNQSTLGKSNAKP